MNGHAKWEYIIHVTNDLQLRGSGMYGGLCFSLPEYW